MWLLLLGSHDERIVHGSDGNRSPSRPRKTYVIAFRPQVGTSWLTGCWLARTHTGDPPPPTGRQAGTTDKKKRRR